MGTSYFRRPDRLEKRAALGRKRPSLPSVTAKTARWTGGRWKWKGGGACNAERRSNGHESISNFVGVARAGNEPGALRIRRVVVRFDRAVDH